MGRQIICSFQSILSGIFKQKCQTLPSSSSSSWIFYSSSCTCCFRITKHLCSCLILSLALSSGLLVTGGTVQGLISDFMGKRAPVLAVSLALAMGALVGYSREYMHIIKQLVLKTQFTGNDSVSLPLRLPERPVDKRCAVGSHWLLHRRSVQYDQLRHICRPGETGGSEGQPGGSGYCYWYSGWNWEYRSCWGTGKQK